MAEVELSYNQKEILSRFKSSLADILTPDDTDAVLLKWLRAGNFNLQKSAQNFRKINLYRKMYSIDTIVEKYVKPKVLQKYERTWFMGFAKDGAPVRYARFSIDIYGFVQSVSAFDLNLYFMYVIEKDIAEMRKYNIQNGYDHNDIIYIMDVDAFNFQDLSYKCVLETILEYLRLGQDVFPEIWRFMLFINAPFFFDKIESLFRPILRKTFIDKVKVASKGATKELLRKYIDDDVLPVFLGGTRVDSTGDPYCSEYINLYCKIPEKYYLKNTIYLIDDTDPGVEAVTIRAKSCYNVSLVIEKADSTIRLEMRTDNGAICFSFFYRKLDPNGKSPSLPQNDEYINPNDESSDVEQIGNKFKVQSHITPCDTKCTAVKPGIYILQFDNTSSWFGSRKLYYRVAVTPPTS